MKASRLCLTLIGSFLFVAALFVSPTMALAADPSIAQSFTAAQNSNIVNAAIVSTEPGTTDTVEPSTTMNVTQLLGVVGDKSLVELSGGSVGVQVVTTGVTSALVSDINGKILAGDKITASPIEGVGMKATASTVVVGTAQEDLDSVATATRTITDKKGVKHAVHIGLLPLQVGVAYYAASGAGNSSSYVPEFLQTLANNVAGRDVSPIRVMLAGLIVLLIFLSVTVLSYSAIRSSLLSIGRNPLSEDAVRKGLLEVGITVVMILALAVLGIYVLLVF